MVFSDEVLAWSAEITALSTVDTDGRFNHYPLVTITASENGQVLAATRITLPMTTEMGCSNCHGSTHALYPASNPYGRDRDNIPALQFQGSPYPIGSDGGCRVCHNMEMEESIHHFDAAAAFRNTR